MKPAAHYYPGSSRGAEAHCHVCRSATALRLIGDHFECSGAHDFGIVSEVRRVLKQLKLELVR